MASNIHPELVKREVLPPGEMEVSIIIVNWRSVAYLKQCLKTVQSDLRNTPTEIIVIDSGSFDGCDRMLAENFPEVHFIQSETNLGFARANNEAFKASRGRLVLFLNPDTEVMSGAIEHLAQQLRATPDAGAVGGRLLNSDRSIQTSCIQSFPTILNQSLDSEILRTWWPKSKLWGTETLYLEGSTPRPVDAISGACVMLRREVFEQVGMFSEDYFMYAEDIDLSYKVRRIGYKNYFVPDAIVVHHGGGSSQGAAAQFAAIMMRESTARFFAKTRTRSYAHGYRAAMLLAAVIRAGVLLLVGPVEYLRGRRHSWMDSLRKWSGVLVWALRREPTVSRYCGGSL